MIEGFLFLSSSFLLLACSVSRGNGNFLHVQDATRFFAAMMDFLAWGEPGAIPC